MTLHFANIILSSDFPMGRMKPATRKKGDWFHSISLFSETDFTKSSDQIDCGVIHFHGERGSPVLESLTTTIHRYGSHKGVDLYTIGAWKSAYGVVGDIRTLDGYENGYGATEAFTFYELVHHAFTKWGYSRIPYAHQRNESYNCVAFVDDIINVAKTGGWSPRIEKMHEKHRLTM